MIRNELFTLAQTMINNENVNRVDVASGFGRETFQSSDPDQLDLSEGGVLEFSIDPRSYVEDPIACLLLRLPGGMVRMAAPALPLPAEGPIPGQLALHLAVANGDGEPGRVTLSNTGTLVVELDFFAEDGTLSRDQVEGMLSEFFAALDRALGTTYDAYVDRSRAEIERMMDGFMRSIGLDPEDFDTV